MNGAAGGVGPTGLPQTCILVADDDEGNRTLLSRILATRNHRVLLAHDGDEALRMAQAPDVDLVLMDQMMPGLTGVEALERLRASHNDVPVIMVTAVGDAAQIARALHAGADDYVTKPFSPVVLLARVERRLRPRAAPPPVVAPVASPALPPPLPPQTMRVEGEKDEKGALTSFFGRLLRGRKTKAEPPVDEDLAAGTVLSGRYEIQEVVGRGAFGVVYRARHVDLESEVAVKVLRRGARSVEEGVTALESFRHEAVRACRIRHLNAVRVSDFGITESSQAYLVMELLNGESLEARIDAQQGKLHPSHAASVMEAVFLALAEAHRHGVIHQDVKAANIFLHLERGVEIPKLIDFGAAGELSSGPSTIVVGTATHMAPERFETGVCNPKTDCYAAGVTLYEALTGEYPHVGLDVKLLRKSHAEGVFILPSALRKGLPTAWDDLMIRLLDKDPNRRPLAVEAAAMIRTLR